MFRAEGDGDEKVSVLSPVNPSTSLPGGSPCRRFFEGHQVAGSTDKFGAERPCGEVFVGSMFEKGTAAGPLPPHRKSRLKKRLTSAEEWGPVGSRLEIGVCQRVARSRIAFGKDPCRGCGTVAAPPPHLQIGKQKS